MRQAIGDFLLGPDDLGIYALMQQLSKAESEFAKIEGQLDSIYKFISPSEAVLREASLNSAVEDSYKELRTLLGLRDALLAQPDESTSDTALRAKAAEASQQIAELTKEIDIRTTKQAEMVNEVVESELFITAVESRVKALQESRTAYDFFGEVRFKFCPSCLTALSESGKEQCHLCKTELDKNSREASYLAALNELAFQKKESTKVLVELRTKLSEHAHYLGSKQRELQTVKSNHVTALRLSSDRVFKLNELSAKIGTVEERIKNYDAKAKLVTAVEGLIQNKQALNNTMLDLTEQITANKAQTSTRREAIEENLSEKTIELLKKDGGFEPAFNEAQTVMFDFGKDFMLVDGRSKFSASSETILKNSFHLAIRTVFDQNAMKATVRPDNCHGTRRRDKPRQRTQRTAVTQHHALPQRMEWDLLGWTDVHLCPCFRHPPHIVSQCPDGVTGHSTNHAQRHARTTLRRRWPLQIEVGKSITATARLVISDYGTRQ
ncbi:hypothetical protein V7V80_19800 [Pseudomonas kermanshahensis]|uniref:Uncharacterized protein n=1 Tax=Pseudomonas kermanshahensis TaxID=2745482 RepID=A0ABU8RAK8_9PSED